MVTISDTTSNGKLFVNEHFVQVVRRNAFVTIIAKPLRSRNINNIQTTVPWVIGDLGHRNGYY